MPCTSCVMQKICSKKQPLNICIILFFFFSLFTVSRYGVHGPQLNVNKVYKLQKKALRIINGAPYNSHTESLFKSSCILPVPSLIQFFKIQFMQQYIQGFLPTLFDNVWITAEAHFVAGQIQYALRNRENFYTPLCRLTSLDKHPYFLFPTIWQEFYDESVKIVRDIY